MLSSFARVRYGNAAHKAIKKMRGRVLDAAKELWNALIGERTSICKKAISLPSKRFAVGSQVVEWIKTWGMPSSGPPMVRMPW